MKSITKIGFIGGGNMAEAMLKGLLSGTFPADQVLVAEPDEARGRLMESRYGIQVVTENLEVVKACELVVLAVKPQIAEEVLTGIAGAFSSKNLLISILAGVSTAVLESYFDGSPRIVRAMPNTPALVGAGATALCAGQYTGADDMLTARHLFEATGSVYVVSEAQMDAVTGLSGSGPAYVFTIIEALADGGVQEGLPRDIALALAVQTLLGAARLVKRAANIRRCCATGSVPPAAPPSPASRRSNKGACGQR